MVQRSMVFPARIKRGGVILLITMLIAALIWVTAPRWLPLLYMYLDVSQLPQHADVIVVLGGSNGQREAYAAQLYNEGYAPRILVSGGVRQSLEDGLQIVRESGIPEFAIAVNDRANSTQDEAEQTLPLLLQMNAHSILLVTDELHSRRALATFRHAFQGHGIAITIASLESGIDPSSWWTTGYKDTVLSEYVKMLYYFFTYGVRSW